MLFMNPVWLSLGENCMPLHLLRRHGLPSPSTPFSSARCCIEHIIQLEQANYVPFLSENYLVKMASGRNDGKSYYYNTFLRALQDFRHGPSEFFEFSHHNPLGADRAVLSRRVERMIQLRHSSSPKIFVYNHRSSQGYEARKAATLYKAFKQLTALYNDSFAVCISQALVDCRLARGISLRYPKPNICFATISSTKLWGGEPDTFNAMHDDDLLWSLLNSARAYFSHSTSSGCFS